MRIRIRNLVRELGKTIPPTRSSQMLELARGSWNTRALAGLHREVRWEKVVMQAYHNACILSQQQMTEPFRYLLGALKEDYEKRRVFAERVMPSVREQVTRILQQAGVDFLFIKGASFLEGYPHGYLRQSNDLDMLFETLDGLLLAAQVLKKHGYHHAGAADTPWLMRVSSSNESEMRIAGQINIKCQKSNHSVLLDLHTTPFVVGPTGMLECNLWDRARARHANIPTPEDRLLILIAHAANHGYFILKDFNDIYALVAQHGDSFQWDYVCRCVQRSTLSYAAHYALSVVDAEYEDSCVPQEVLGILNQSKEVVCSRAIRLTSTSSKKWRSGAESLMYTLHTLAFEKARYGVGSGLKKAIEYLCWAFSLYSMQRTVGDLPIARSLLRSNRSLLFPAPRRGPQIPLVRAVEVCDCLPEHKLRTCLQRALSVIGTADTGDERGQLLEAKPVGHSMVFLRLGEAEAVLTPIDLFIPTDDGIFTEADIAAVERLAQRLIGQST